jgi:hypothetical protein
MTASFLAKGLAGQVCGVVLPETRARNVYRIGHQRRRAKLTETRFP